MATGKSTQEQIDAIAALAAAMTAAADRLSHHLDQHPGDPDAARLVNLRDKLKDGVIHLTAAAIQVLGDGVKKEMAKLEAISMNANEFVKKIDSIKKGLKVVASLLNVAASLFIGDISGVVTAFEGVHSALKEGDDAKDGAKAKGGGA